MARAGPSGSARSLEDAMDAGNHIRPDDVRRQERHRRFDRVPELRSRLPDRRAGAAQGGVRPWRCPRPATRGDRGGSRSLGRASGSAGSTGTRGPSTGMSGGGPRTIATLWQTAVTRADSVPAYLIDDGESWREVSWAQAGARVDELAHGLLGLGIARGDRFAILGSTRLEWALLDFALGSIGAVVVPIYPTSSANECSYILADSEVRAIVVE